MLRRNELLCVWMLQGMRQVTSEVLVFRIYPTVSLPFRHRHAPHKVFPKTVEFGPPSGSRSVTHQWCAPWSGILPLVSGIHRPRSVQWVCLPPRPCCGDLCTQTPTLTKWLRHTSHVGQAAQDLQHFGHGCLLPHHCCPLSTPILTLTPALTPT